MSVSIEYVQPGILPELVGNFKIHTIRVIRKVNLQHILYFTALLTFGIGDGLTGAHMMGKLGANMELNPVARQIFITYGFWAVLAAKIWFTMMILFAICFVQIKLHKNSYWTVNGLLIALAAGGMMAMNANMAVITGAVPQSSSEILLLYFSMVLILPEFGSIVDKWTDIREIRPDRDGLVAQH